mgnify:CR=1 FL=1
MRAFCMGLVHQACSSSSRHNENFLHGVGTSDVQLPMPSGVFMGLMLTSAVG